VEYVFQSVANIVEPNGVRKLGEEHRQEMAQDAEGAGLGFHACLEGVPVDHSTRNEVENQLENDHIGPGWCYFVHTLPASGRHFSLTQTSLLPSIMNSCGMTVRILFVHRGLFSGTMHALIEQWRRAEPNVEIVCRDVDQLSFGSLLQKLRGLPHAVANGGLKVLRPGGGFGECLRKSPFYWKRIRETTRIVYQKETSYQFGISIGTIVPIINPKFPIFIYTDNTILANKSYHGGEERYLFWEHLLPLEKEVIGKAARIFTMSVHVSQTLLEEYSVTKENVVQVGAGCNSPKIRQVDPMRYERRSILFVGLDWERKGGPDLVKAFQILKTWLPDATLTIAGADPPGIAGNGIEVLGRVDQSGVSKLMASASVFAMPSLREPFGIVFLEAMHSGMAVLASRQGAPPDFVEDGVTGYLVAPGDVEGIAHGLFEILKDPKIAAEMGRRAKARVSEEYTWETVQKRMSSAINQAMSITASS